MTISANTPFLRQVLLLDAAASGATGLLMASLATTLSGLLAVPAPLLFWSGATLLPFAAALVFLATRDEIAHWAVWAAIAINAMWVADSFYVAFAAGLEPNALGVTFIVGQALVVALFAELELTALRRIGAPRYA